MPVAAHPVGQIVEPAPSGRIVAERIENPEGPAHDGAAARAARAPPGTAGDRSLHGTVDDPEVCFAAGNMGVGIGPGIGIAIDRLSLNGIGNDNGRKDQAEMQQPAVAVG